MMWTVWWIEEAIMKIKQSTNFEKEIYLEKAPLAKPNLAVQNPLIFYNTSSACQ